MKRTVEVTQPTAFFDEHGRCRLVHSSGRFETELPHAAPVPAGSLPADLWFDVDTQQVRQTSPADAQAALGIPEVIEAGVPVEITVPDGCVALINGREYVGTAEVAVEAGAPVYLLGRLTGRATLKTYVEARIAAYPSIPDQLDVIYHRGLEGWRADIAAVKARFPKPAPMVGAPVAEADTAVVSEVVEGEPAAVVPEPSPDI